MFFVLSKIIWALINPANLGVLFLLSGMIIFRRWRRVGVTLMTCSACIFLCFGVLPVGNNMMVMLERSASRPDPMPSRIAGILVLGGGVDTVSSAISGQPEVNDSADRIIAGLTLAKDYPDARLVFSGGSGLLLGQGLPESQVLRQLLANIGGDIELVSYEDTSRNTYENIRNSQLKFSPQPGETWILVTSAYHMKRSLAVAQHFGWDFVPYPVDYRSTGRYVFLPGRYDALRALNLSDIALREWVGLLAYRVTGKI